MADESDSSPEDLEKVQRVDAWVKMLLIRSGVRVINMRGCNDPPAYGLVNVPAKYVNIIDSMHIAMTALAVGDPLPEFTPLPPVSKKGIKKKR